MVDPQEPTADEIKARVVKPSPEGFSFPTWYPQMGGYVGKAVVEFEPNRQDGSFPCFNVSIWHDGDFPFTGERTGQVEGDCENCGRPYRSTRSSSSNLHHCGADQFVRFGIEVLEAQTPHVTGKQDASGLCRLAARLLAVADKVDPQPTVIDQIVDIIRDFDNWVACNCSECHHDSRSHSVNCNASKEAMIKEILARLNP